MRRNQLRETGRHRHEISIRPDHVCHDALAKGLTCALHDEPKSAAFCCTDCPTRSPRDSPSSASGLAKTDAERALSNLAVMTEGGLVANRLNRVARMVNNANPPDERIDPTGSLLSPREVQVLSLFTTDETLKGIGRRLYISRNTVKTYTARIYRKLGASDQYRAVAAAPEARPPLVQEAFERTRGFPPITGG